MPLGTTWATSIGKLDRNLQELLTLDPNIGVDRPNDIMLQIDYAKYIEYIVNMLILEIN